MKSLCLQGRDQQWKSCAALGREEISKGSPAIVACFEQGLGSDGDRSEQRHRREAGGTRVSPGSVT